MISNILNILLMLAFVHSIVYGIVIMTKNKDTKLIFKVTLIAMIAFLISRLFFVVLIIAEGDENTFSVGVLGQVAGYLFLVLANKTYLPFKADKHKFNFLASLILIFPISIYTFCFISSKTANEIICSILYLSSTCLALYFAFNNLLLCKNDEKYKPLKLFFISIIVITSTSTIENIFAYINNETLLIIIRITLTIICCINSVLMLPLLNKGVKKYDC